MPRIQGAPLIFLFITAQSLAWTGCAGSELSPQSSMDTQSPKAKPVLARNTHSGRRAFLQPESGAPIQDMSPQNCSQGFHPQSDTISDLARLAALCAKSNGLIAITNVYNGQFEDLSSEVDRFQFKGRGGHCYRILSVGGEGITDLDIAVIDSDNRLATADLSSDAFPIVPPRGFLCLKQEETFTIQVAAQQGNGHYALQVWGSPSPESSAR